MYIAFLVFIGLAGTAFGSFAGAQVWRLRARQLEEDKKNGEKVSRTEYSRLKPLLKKSIKEDRSRCLSCGHELAWYDLLPIVSWVTLRGRCRYCKKQIGWTEFLLETCLGLIFVCSIIFWPGDISQPIEWAKIFLWLSALVVLAINFVYDMRWSLLVSWLNWALIGLGVIFATLTIISSGDITAGILSTAGSVLVLGGLYGLLWLISRGKWVGEGDIYLGTGIGLFLGDWKLALIALFLANLVGTLIVLPSLMTNRLERGSHIPFGPLLIIGGLLAWFFGPTILDWYQNLVFLI